MNLIQSLYGLWPFSLLRSKAKKRSSEPRELTKYYLVVSFVVYIFFFFFFILSYPSLLFLIMCIVHTGETLSISKTLQKYKVSISSNNNNNVNTHREQFYEKKKNTLSDYKKVEDYFYMRVLGSFFCFSLFLRHIIFMLFCAISPNICFSIIIYVVCVSISFYSEFIIFFLHSFPFS